MRSINAHNLIFQSFLNKLAPKEENVTIPGFCAYCEADCNNDVDADSYDKDGHCAEHTSIKCGHCNTTWSFDEISQESRNLIASDGWCADCNRKHGY